MSSEIDHPHQRTVAELLAEHGDAGASGRRRRRREAESDTVEPADDAAFVYGGAAPELTRWSADRSVLRDPVPPDDGTASWDPIGAGRAAHGSAPWEARGTDAGGWGADVGGGGPPAADRAPVGGYVDGGRPIGGRSGEAVPRGGRSAVNGWSGGSDVDPSAWSSGPDDFRPDDFRPDDFRPDDFGPDDFGPDGVGLDRVVPGAAVGQGWAHGGFPAGNTGAVDPNGGTARSDVPLRNGSANRPPVNGDPHAGSASAARGGVPPRAGAGGAYAAMLADLEPDRPDGAARLAIPLRDAPRSPRAGAAQPVPRRVPDLARQSSPVRGDSTAIIDPGLARPLSPVPGVEGDRVDGAPTRVSGPFGLGDDQPAGLGRAWSGRDHAGPAGRPPAVRAPADRRPADLDTDLDEPSHAPVRSRRKAPSSSGQAWAGVLAQWILGAIGGAALWVGFRFLWQELTVVAIAAAVIVTVGLVLVVRHLLRNDDRRTTVFAVLIGLLLTVSPALLVLLHR